MLSLLEQHKDQDQTDPETRYGISLEQESFSLHRVPIDERILPRLSCSDSEKSPREDTNHRRLTIGLQRFTSKNGLYVVKGSRVSGPMILL